MTGGGWWQHGPHFHAAGGGAWCAGCPGQRGIEIVDHRSITGTVVNSTGGAGVAYAKVTVTGTATQATTSSSGSFSLSHAINGIVVCNGNGGKAKLFCTSHNLGRSIRAIGKR